jgi:DNA-binding FadR family transcriptional regulator
MTKGKDPIRRRKLSDEVRERLQKLIREQSLKPGDTIPSERELMVQFGVGRPAVREAMQALQGLGLVEINHGERPRIAEPSVANMLGQLGESMRHTLANSATSLDDLKEARALFEAQMVKIAAEQSTPEQLTRLRETLDNQALARKKPEEFLRLDGAFHAAIADISGNPIFATLSRSLFGWLAEFHSSLVRAPSLEQLTLDEHEGIFEAISRRDTEEAASRMLDHLNRADSQYSRENLNR